MGLTFTVGTAADVFLEDFARQVEQELVKQLRYSIPSPLDLDPYHSEEVAWYGWAQLQQLAVMALGEDKVTHLLAVDAWRGVYLPIRVAPTVLAMGNGDDESDSNEQTWLQCASLPELIRELEQLATTRSLPTDLVGLQELWEKYYQDESLADEDMDIQTYAQLMLSTKVATARSLPLWVVK